jgi:hypothetical protein
VAKRLVALLGAVALAAALSAPAVAGPNDPVVFSLPQQGDQSHHTADPVDYLTWCGDCIGTDYTTGAPWVVNPHDSWPYFLPTNGAFEPGCMWDSDDHYNWASSGAVVAANTTVGITECRYAAGFGTNGCCPQLATDVLITSASSALVVQEKWQWGVTTVTHAIPAVFDSVAHNWRYFGCVWSPPLVSGDTLVTIPNSHGGTAVPQLITVTITNPTGQKIGKTGGVIESGLIAGMVRGCSSWVPA